ncbi:MAG: chemotaxis protein CheW [Cypionkella sp.]
MAAQAHIASGFPEAASAPPLGQTTQQYVMFRSAGGHYGADIMQVQEIRSWQPTTPLPNRPRASRGVMDIRGTVVEVYDLSILLGGTALEPDAGSVVLVLSLLNRVVGLLVEAVSDIIQVETGATMGVPANSDDARGTCLSGMVNYEGALVGLLDFDPLL